MHGATTRGGNYRNSQDKLLESSEVESGMTNYDAAKEHSIALHRIPLDESVTLHDSSRANSRRKKKYREKRNTEVKKDKTTETKNGLINVKHL
jgi:hypothetical protein